VIAPGDAGSRSYPLSTISHQPSAISHQPSAISHQPSAISQKVTLHPPDASFKKQE